MDEIQQIKDRINIADIVGQYVTLRRAGRNFVGRCPFHKERTPSFHVSAERGTYKCFGCGEGGDAFSFLQKIDGTDFPTVLKQLAEKAGVKLEPRAGARTQRPEEKQKEERLREVCEAAVEYFTLEYKRRKDVQAYTEARGVHQETAASWRLGYAPASWDELSRHLEKQGFSKEEIVEAGFAVKSEKRPGEVFDRFRGRIIFPIFDVAGQPVAVSGRFFEKVPGQKGDDPAKYVNSPETPIFKKSRTLYGLDRARGAIRKADCILLVEGQFDVVLSHQSGLPFTVALSGTALTPEHLSLLSRLSKRLVLALDADAAGVRSGLRSAQMAIAAGFDVKVPAFPPGQDPADVAKENPELLKAAIRTSKTAVEFFMDALRPGAKDERAYKKEIELQVLPLVAAIGSRIEQEHFISLIARRLGVSEAAVRAEVGKRPAPAEEGSSSLHEKSAESALPAGSASPSSLSPLQKKVGMLWAKFDKESEVGQKLIMLIGEQEFAGLAETLVPMGEELRFRFDAELGEHTTESQVAADMLLDIERQLSRERFKMKFV